MDETSKEEAELDAKVRVNFRGHNGYSTRYVRLDSLRTYWRHHVRTAVYMFGLRRERWGAESSLMKKLLELPQTSFMSQCSLCGNAVSIEETSPGSMKVKATKPCPAPKGYPSFEITLDCPSGKIVVGNDFRNLFPDERDDYDSVNSVSGVIKEVKRFEKYGMVHFLVGNSSPTVFQKGKSNLCITRVYDEKTDEREVPGKGYKVAAWICTDLWWVSAMDYGLYKKLCKEKKIKVSDLRPAKVLDVKPGKWVFKYNPMEGCEFTLCFGEWRP